MSKPFHHAGRAIGAGLLALVLCFSLGCTSKESTDAQTTSQKQTTYGRAVQKARDAAASLSNPKVGTDPVCGMAIDENAVVVTIDEKDYGVCSQKCAEELRTNPDKYLVAAATDGHEGHDH